MNKSAGCLEVKLSCRSFCERLLNVRRTLTLTHTEVRIFRVEMEEEGEEEEEEGEEEGGEEGV